MQSISIATTAVAPMTTIAFDVTDWTDQQVGRLRDTAATIASEAASPEPLTHEESESTGWTADTYIEAVTRLLRKHHVQVAVIFDAVKTDNPFVTRERVYEIGSYPAQRALKGFTRPVNKVQQDLVDEGVLPEDAADLMETVYDPQARSRALGFRIPREILRVAQEARAKQDAAESA